MNELNRMTWNMLPDSLLLKIFSWIEESDMVHASSTCTRWRRMFYEPRFWRSITFDFNHSFQSPEDIEMKLRNHVQAIGTSVKHLKIICPDTDFLVKQHLIDWVKGILDTLAEHNSTIQSFQLKHLQMVCNGRSCDYAKCDLIVSLCLFLESQTCLQTLDLSEALLPTTFGHMVMSSLDRSPSVDTLQRLDIFFLYAFGSFWSKNSENLIRSVFRKLKKLKEITLNHTLLEKIKIEQLCKDLQHSLEKLELKGNGATQQSVNFTQRNHTIFDDAENVDYSDGDSEEDDEVPSDPDDDITHARKCWTQATRECPRLRVSMDVHVDYDRLEDFMLSTIPVSDLTIRGIYSSFDDDDDDDDDDEEEEWSLRAFFSKCFYGNLETVTLIGHIYDYEEEPMMQVDPARIASMLMRFPRLRSVQISTCLMSYSLLERVHAELRARYGVDRHIITMI